MKISLEQPGPDNMRIEIVPLIDVIFCILIFFILAALQLTRQQAIGVDLPSAGTSTLQEQQSLLVTVDALGKTYVDSSEVSESQLYLILEGYRRTNPVGMMLLYADRNSIYNDVINILDLMRSVGGNRVALATLPPTTPTNPQTNTLPDAGVPLQPLTPNADPLQPFPNLLPGVPGNPAPQQPAPNTVLPNGTLPNGTLPNGTLPGGPLPSNALPGGVLPPSGNLQNGTSPNLGPTPPSTEETGE
jgi:biopolymer transport protein ExbD